MNKINHRDIDIEKISKLSQIEVLDDKEILSKQIENIISWIAKLNEVDTDNIEPMITIHNEPIKLNSDQIENDTTKDLLLKNAPKQIYGYFAVPKVIE